MTFEEAKHRNDYRFRLNGIEDLIDDIRNNCMKGLYPENEPYLSEAVLEIGYMDVEVNIYAYCQCSEKAVPEDKRPAIDYLRALKQEKTMKAGIFANILITLFVWTGMRIIG